MRIWTDDVDARSIEPISRDVPVGRAQHKDNRVQVDAVRPFEPGLASLLRPHPQLLKAFGTFSKWASQRDLTEVVHTLEQVECVKGGSPCLPPVSRRRAGAFPGDQ